MAASKRYYGFASENLPGLLHAASDILSLNMRVRFALISGGFAAFGLAINMTVQTVSASGAHEAAKTGSILAIVLKALYFLYSVYSLLYVLRLNNSVYVREKIDTLPWVLCRFPGRFLILNIDEIESFRQQYSRSDVLRMSRESRKRMKHRFHGDESRFSKDVLEWLDRNPFWAGTPIFEEAIYQMLQERNTRGDVDKLLDMGFSFFGNFKGAKRTGNVPGNA